MMYAKLYRNSYKKDRVFVPFKKALLWKPKNVTP